MSTRQLFCQTALVLSVIGAAIAPAPTLAQTTDTATQSAPQPSFGALRRIINDAEQPLEARRGALLELVQIAPDENENARFYTAQRLLSPELAPADGQAQAFALLETLSAEGHTPSQTYYAGQLLRTGTDPEKAVALLEAATQAGDIRAMRQLGQVFAAGEIVAQDGARAVALYEQMGNADGAFRAGQLLLSGRIVEGDPARARTLLASADAEGDLRATLALVRGHLGAQFGAQSDPAVARDGLARLNAAADTGSTRAAGLLVTYYTSTGRSDPEAADRLAELSTQFSADLSERSLARITRFSTTNAFDSALAQISGTRGRTALATAFGALPDSDRRSALIRTFREDRNAYVFLVQDHLRTTGLYSGPRTGLLTASTIRAIDRFCRQNNMTSRCFRGPLHRNTAIAIADNI